MSVDQHNHQHHNHSVPLLVLILVLFTVSTRARPIDEQVVHDPQHQHPPPLPPATMQGPPPFVGLVSPYSRHKAVNQDAFRPTSPGHSPGVGHDSPPTIAP
ncbi:hypothetical protein LINGRAHAP2_LOCUS13532 [Linum grandiflorum]